MTTKITVYGDPLVGSQGFVQFNQAGVQSNNVPYTNSSDALGSILTRRASDGHYFLFGEHTLNYEFDENLTFVQTFAISRPFSGGFGATSQPRSIQFVNGFCYLTWFDQTHGISVQKCDASTLAVITTWTFANPGTGVNPYVFAVTTDGLKAYCSSSGGGSSQTNKVWVRDLIGGSTSLFVTNGTWVSSTGYAAWSVGVRPNGDVLIFWVHFTSGNNDGDLLTLYDSSGTLKWSITPGIGLLTPAMGCITITNDDTAWLIPAFGGTGQPFKSFLLSDGSVVTNATSPTDIDINGTGAGGFAVEVTNDTPTITNLSVDCANKNILITGTNFTSNPTISLTRDGIQQVFTVLYITPTQILVNVPGFQNGKWCALVLALPSLESSDMDFVLTSDGFTIFASA